MLELGSDYSRHLFLTRFPPRGNGSVLFGTAEGMLKSLDCYTCIPNGGRPKSIQITNHSFVCQGLLFAGSYIKRRKEQPIFCTLLKFARFLSNSRYITRYLNQFAFITQPANRGMGSLQRIELWIEVFVF